MSETQEKINNEASQPVITEPEDPDKGVSGKREKLAVGRQVSSFTAHQKADKFKLLCACIGLIERRYDGKRSRLNLNGFCDRINLRKDKYNEMVEKAPVEVILYLMGVLVKLIEDIENGRNRSFNTEKEEDATTDEDKERILNMVMDRMIQEEKEERQRQQQMMQAQVQYATMMAQNYLPGFFQGGAPPNVVIPGVGSYPMGAMYGGGQGMNGGQGYRNNVGSAPYNPYAGAPQVASSGYFGQQPSQTSQPSYPQQPSQSQYSRTYQPSRQPQPPQQPQPSSHRERPTYKTPPRNMFNFEEDMDFDIKKFGAFETDFPIKKTDAQPDKPVKRGRGRPKGAKNKPKPPVDPNAPPKPKRGRGRPKGSKNKTK